MSAVLDSPLSVSVVIPFYNRKQEVRPCLEAVLAQELPPEIELEIIAVDNGSTDGTLEELERYPVKVVECERRGPAAARNAAIAEAGGTIIAMTDSDCVPASGWLAKLLEPFADPDVIGAGGRIDTLERDCGVTIFAEMYHVLDNSTFFEGRLGYPPFVATANAAYRRQAMIDVGGFDEELKIGEDADLAWRILDLGGKLAYCPHAAVKHGHRRTIDGFTRQAYAYGTGSTDVFAKHRHRMGKWGSFHWENVRTLAAMPITIAWNLFFGRDGFDRKRMIYEAIWRTYFTLGQIRQSFKHRFIYL